MQQCKFVLLEVAFLFLATVSVYERGELIPNIG